MNLAHSCCSSARRSAAGALVSLLVLLLAGCGASSPAPCVVAATDGSTGDTVVLALQAVQSPGGNNYLLLDQPELASIAAALRIPGDTAIAAAVSGTPTFSAQLSDSVDLLESADEVFEVLNTLTFTAADVGDLAEIGWWSATALDATQGVADAATPSFGDLPDSKMVQSYATTISSAQTDLFNATTSEWCSNVAAGYYCPQIAAGSGQSILFVATGAQLTAFPQPSTTYLTAHVAELPDTIIGQESGGGVCTVATTSGCPRLVQLSDGSSVEMCLAVLGPDGQPDPRFPPLPGSAISECDFGQSQTPGPALPSVCPAGPPTTSSAASPLSTVSSPPSASAPDLVGSWMTAPQLNGLSPAQGLKLNVSNQTAAGQVSGTLYFFGDGLLEPTLQVEVTGSVSGDTISLRGSGVSFTGTYLPGGSPGIDFTANLPSGSGASSFTGELFMP
jgi:hypothetical protein